MFNLKTATATLAILLVTSVATTSHAYDYHTPKAQDSMSMKMDKTMNLSTTSTFKGVEVNGGTASLYKKGNEYRLKVSDDFMLPTSPAPHWQIVDAQGNVFLLQQFNIAGDKKNKDIMLPKYIKSVAKVQVWCSFAEVVLGEASFKSAQRLNRG